jgi:single-strand DNA-binding protein
MYNNVMLVGNIGRDPESKRVGREPITITKFSLATSEFFNNSKKTQWHYIVCFGKTAEFVAKYCSKGDAVVVAGAIRYEKREKEVDGCTQTVTYTNIYANSVTSVKKSSPENIRTKSVVKEKPGDDEGGTPFPF